MDVEEYLAKHDITSMLNGIVNDLVRDQPDDAISYMVNGLFAAAAQKGQEPVFLARLLEMRKALAEDQKAAAVVAAEKTKLAAEVDKLKYQVTHLKKTLDEFEKGGAAAPAAAAPAAAVGVPVGHTPFSWAGGVEVAAASATSAPAGADELGRDAFTQRTNIKRIMTAGAASIGKTIVVAGWARSNRKQAALAFIGLNDGSCAAPLQLVIEKDKISASDWDAVPNYTGYSLTAEGELVESPAAGQAVEMKVSKITIVGSCDVDTYPLPPGRHSLEFLRSKTHLRPRTGIFGAVMRIRNALAFATHSFFQSHGFQYVNSPIITGSDCEGAGEMFQVTTLDLEKLPLDTEGKVDYNLDFFNKQAFLTVSGQLNGEHYACAVGSIYTFGPTFRAENSNTTRHLAEFWMIEPEIAFADIIDDMNCAEGYLRHCIQHVLDNCKEDVEFLNKFGEDKQLASTLKMVADTDFKRITYTEAIDLLVKVKGKEWEHKPEWGHELQTEHERYLAEVHFKKPVIVYNYPKDCKAFYMRLNDDDKTVAAMDVLFPRLGEMVGGSQREERLDVLLKRMKEMGLEQEGYEAYLDLRRFGTQKHAGFGVGFERLVTYCTGMGNIRDVIPFPRAPGTMPN